LQCRAIVPNSSPRRANGGVLRLFGCLSYLPRSLLVPIDWGQSIYHPSSGLQCRAIVPNSSPRRANGGVLRLFGCLSYLPRSLLVPIDWGQSIYHPSSGLQCRAIVLNSSPRRVSGGVLRFSAVYPTGHGTSWFRSIGDNRSTIPAASLSQQQSFNLQL
jgi:hypothetical protein